MIFITGDTHGHYERFSSHIFPEQKQMTKDDYVIVCGDFGIWDTSKSQQHWMDWLNEKRFTTLFVDGNHENYDLLNTFPISEWTGGRVQFIRESVIHLMRGQVFMLQGKKFFTMGGAASVPVAPRLPFLPVLYSSLHILCCFSFIISFLPCIAYFSTRPIEEYYCEGGKR